MKIVFVHQGGERMASFRYRAEIPGVHLRDLGHEVTLNGGEGDVVIFSKPMLTDYEIAKDCKAQGARIVVDLGDDHLTHPVIGPMYNQMIKIADKIVCPTQNMAERVYRVSGISPEVVPDPYEEPLQPPHADGRHLLWFGHLSNLRDLTPWKPALNGIRICTGPRPQQPEKAPKEGRKLVQTGPTWDENYIEWSPETQTSELSSANITVIPSRRGAEFKSPNRLLNSVRAGCFVVAGGSPSHDEFRKMLWIGDIKAGLDWSKAFQSELNDRVTEAQEYIGEKYSPNVIAKRWQEILS